MKNFLLTAAVLGAIADSLLNPERGIWQWFRHPTFNLWVVAGGVFVGYWIIIILQSAGRSRDEQARTRSENAMRQSLQPEDYKRDKYQGSFNSVPTRSQWDPHSQRYEVTDAEAIPKPPEPVPGFWSGFWKEMKDE